VLDERYVLEFDPADSVTSCGGCNGAPRLGGLPVNGQTFNAALMLGVSRFPFHAFYGQVHIYSHVHSPSQVEQMNILPRCSGTALAGVSRSSEVDQGRFPKVEIS
jgi:hypothetical protein